jgi:peptidoglycan/xylan/chitin deacetylase (PgdA/CDA1 family)
LSGSAAAGARSIAILCFHAVEHGPAPLCLTPASFERQVKELHEQGCQSLTVREVARRISSGEGFPERAVAFTFDDGFASVHSAALGLLDSLGFTATVFPLTAHLDGSAARPAEHCGLALLTGTQVCELHAAGWEIGGHTHTHPRLPELRPAQIEAELARSNAILEGLIGTPIRAFAYPYGLNDAGTRAVTRGVYDACMTVGASKATTSSSLDRVERIEAWYMQRDWAVQHLHDPLGTAYLALRRAGRAISRLAGGDR